MNTPAFPLAPMNEFTKTTETIEILRDVKIAERQLAEGRGVPHEEARSRLLSWLEARRR